MKSRPSHGHRNDRRADDAGGRSRDSQRGPHGEPVRVRRLARVRDRVRGRRSYGRAYSDPGFRADLESVLIDMIGMRVVQMSIMQIVDMIAVPDGRVPAVRPVLVIVMGMMRFIAGAHDYAP